MSIKFAWIVWVTLTLIGAVSLSFALPSPVGSERVSEMSALFLPGETTHGHYQIELKCQACHDRFGGVREESCMECHGADLKASKDTHPKSKFDDPVNAALLTVIDARSCIACHTEHAEERTHPMGVSVPTDYCWQCHKDVAEQRPSHEGMAYNSCATAGCHNFHDNSALYENFLKSHAKEPDILDNPHVPPRKVVTAGPKSLKKADQDGPADSDPAHVEEWAVSQHALAGVNCSGCHQPRDKDSGKLAAWSDAVSIDTCSSCHDDNVDGFHKGLHGMRLASGLDPMSPGLARLAMKPESLDRMLDCSSCHSPHKADTTVAAAESCLSCHNDEHSLAYESSSHAELWRAEVDGSGLANSGVSCATCHLPRDDDGLVEHNQNANLEPNEKMIRSVCMNCHGLEYSIDALADPALIRNCFSSPPETHVPSVDMAVKWFEQKEREKQERLARRKKKSSG